MVFGDIKRGCLAGLSDKIIWVISSRFFGGEWMGYRSSAVISLCVSMVISVLLCGSCIAAVSDAGEPNSISLTADDEAAPSSQWRHLPCSMRHQDSVGLLESEIVSGSARYGWPTRLPLIGLSIFRSRHSKRRFRPANDSDPWQIIFGCSSTIC